MKKKCTVMLLITALLCCLFTGCVGEIGQINLNEDGSGSMTLSAGFTEQAMQLMESMGEGEGTTSSDEEMVPFTYNGYTYYGAVKTVEFSSVEEFNTIVKEFNESEDTEVETGIMTLTQKEDGSFALAVTATAETGNTEEMEQAAASDGSMSEEDLAALFAGMAAVFEFEFPATVTQKSGPTGGVSIENEKLILDFIAMGEELNGNEATYLFETEAKSTEVPDADPYFTDVPEGKWYHAAIIALAKGGLVTGMGDQKFSPDGTLTYAQFAQIVSNAEGIPAERINGYWAGGAITNCLEKGYIANLGEITAANYNVPITREAAVAAMYLAKASSLGEPQRSLTSADIPDFDQISAEYQDLILKAYNYNITDGMKADHTFVPQGTLTRAQVCQLFYNLDWTEAAK